MALPKFEFCDIAANPTGWGPLGSPPALDTSIPFQQYNKADRIGRVADWIGVDRFFYRRGNERYNERMYGSAANAGSQFDYVHGMDENNFQLVDSSKPVQRNPQRNFRARQLQFKKLLQKEQERRDQAMQGQNLKMKRSIANYVQVELTLRKICVLLLGEQQRAFKMWQRRGGNARQGQRGLGGRYPGERPKDRLPSVQVRPEWQVIEEMDFPRLLKLSLPGVGNGEDIGKHLYGTLHYYDKTIDRVSVRTPITLQRCGGNFYNITTTEDPVIEELAQQGVGNVFATDIILATLMTAPRSVYSWDIVAHRVGDKLFLDKRDTGGISNPVDALTVSETSGDPPSFEGAGINNAKDLATEALFINQNFRRQVLKRNEQPYVMANPRAPFEEEGGESGCGYRYRKWNLGKNASGKPIEVVCRTEHDGVMAGPSGDIQFLTIKAFNEWDSSQSGGVDWRVKLDGQKGAVLATEIKNNSCKLAKWTVQALLANSDAIKFGYVSRMSVRNSAQHVILGTQQLRPVEFAQNISMNLDNGWGILRCIIDSCMRQPQGKYLLMKDPQSPVIRLYSLPEGTFESDQDSNEDHGGESDEDN